MEAEGRNETEWRIAACHNVDSSLSLSHNRNPDRDQNGLLGGPDFHHGLLVVPRAVWSGTWADGPDGCTVSEIHAAVKFRLKLHLWHPYRFRPCSDYS